MIPKQIFLHHSLTKDSGSVSWPAIRRYHTQELGWSAIGYHFGIEVVNDDVEVLVGRFMNVQGAHTKGHNSNSLGICFMGNFDLAPPDPAIWAMGLGLVRSLMAVFDIKAEAVLGHRERCDYKSCPGTMFDLDRFRSELKRG